MKLNRKAQESRNDLAILYAICFGVVLVSVGALYGFGIIGSSDFGSVTDGGMTGAVVVEGVSGEVVEEVPEEIEEITGEVEKVNDTLDTPPS